MLAATQESLAQQPRYSVGQKVEVYHGVNWYPAEVVELPKSGWVKLTFKNRTGKVLTLTLPPNNVRPLRGAAAPKAAKKPAPAAKARTWTDSTGKFKIDAQLVEFKDDQVTLRRTDGKTISLPLNRLSQQDQQFVKTSQAKPEAENPFAVEDESPGAKTVASAEPGAADVNGALRKSDWSSAQILNVQAPDAWNVTPDPAPASPALSKRGFAISPTAFFEDVKYLLFDPAGAKAYVGLVDEPPGKVQQSRLEVCDLAKGKSLGSIPLPNGVGPLDVQPGGKRLLTNNGQFMPGRNELLSLWTLSSKEAGHVMSWNPYEAEDWTGRDVKVAAFLDANHVLTLNPKGKLAVWDLTKPSVDYWLQLGFACHATVSPGANTSPWL